MTTQTTASIRNFDSLTKDWALDVLCDRIIAKFPDADRNVERATLARRSRARLLHSVGAQLYGNPENMDKGLVAYAYDQMTDDERRFINQAG